MYHFGKETIKYTFQTFSKENRERKTYHIKMQKYSFFVKATIWIFPVGFVFSLISSFNLFDFPSCSVSLGYNNKRTYSKANQSTIFQTENMFILLDCIFIFITPFSKTVGDQYFHRKITLKCMIFCLKVLLKVTCLYMFYNKLIMR